MKSRTLLLISAALGTAGIAIGAFGAHVLTDLLAGISDDQILEREDWLETGVRYHMYHVPALMALAFASERLGKVTWVAWLWIVGVLIFSGCLYAMSLTGIRILGAIVPIGGLSLLAGWVVLGVKAWSTKPE